MPSGPIPCRHAGCSTPLVDTACTSWWAYRSSAISAIWPTTARRARPTSGRWLVERYLERLCRAVKAEDPQAVVTYVNYPSTEYLQLPFLDFVCFNVYLESQERLE